MEGHAKKCVERYCELANEKTEQLYKVSTPCLDGHNFKKEELETIGEMSKVCSRIVLKCMYLSRIGRPVILWSRNKLARAVTKRTRACDKRLARLTSYIHHTSDHRQYCHVVMRRIIFGIVPRFGFCWRRGESSVFSRNKLQCPTVQLNLKLFLWTPVFAWTEYPRLIFVTW